MTLYKDWFNTEDIRPYVFARKVNLPSQPGKLHNFRFDNVGVRDPFFLDQTDFANQILRLENQCFQASGMILPRWAYYDCSLMPGFAVGFAYRASKLPKNIGKVIEVSKTLEWVPISLFIAIPTNQPDHWVAHNLCSVNSILPHDERMSCLGFLSKALGLWYFNIRNLYGMTQWGSTAIRVHTNYGDLKVVSSYTNIHDYPETLTYLVEVDSQRWQMFLDDVPTGIIRSPSSYIVNPKDTESMKQLQRALERGEGPFYLNGDDFLGSKSTEAIKVYL